jgi:hypothetical protein
MTHSNRHQSVLLKGFTAVVATIGVEAQMEDHLAGVGQAALVAAVQTEAVQGTPVRAIRPVGWEDINFGGV